MGVPPNFVGGYVSFGLFHFIFFLIYVISILDSPFFLDSFCIHFPAVLGVLPFGLVSLFVLYRCLSIGATALGGGGGGSLG